MNCRVILGFALLASLPFDPVAGAIYSYKDENGHITLTDSPWHNKFEIVVKTLKKRQGVSEKGSLAVPPPPLPERSDLQFNNAGKFKDEVALYARHFNLDPRLVQAVIKTESDFQPRAVSRAGAQGLMQLMPDTAKLMGVTDSFSPRDNIMGGTKYLRLMLDTFNQNIEFALAGYNAGPMAVKKHKGIPPYKETINYVKKVKHYYGQFSKTGFDYKSLEVIEPYVVRGIRLFRQGNLQGALQEFSFADREKPHQPVVQYNLGCVYDMLGNYQESLQRYNQAIAVDPFFEQAYYNQAIVYEKLGKNFKAIESWNYFLQSSKDKARLLEAEKYIEELKQFARANN